MSPDFKKKEDHQKIADDADNNFNLTREEIEQIDLKPGSCCFWVFRKKPKR